MKLFKIQSSNEVTEILVDEDAKSEKSIEDIIELNPNLITGDKLFIIGRQVQTDTRKFLDLLAVDKEGSLVVIELKRGYAPRDIVAQILDYSSWLSELSERRIEDIAKQYISATGIKYTNFHDAFKKYYSSSECPEIGGKNRVRNILMAKEFSDELTALFGPDSPTAIRLINNGQAHLAFSEYNQSYLLPCKIRNLPTDSEGFQATYWHNKLFNPNLPGKVLIVGFQPDWASAQALPPTK